MTTKAQEPMVAWMRGSSQISETGNYGTIGVATATNTPGARYGSATLTLSNGKMVLFGGQGYGPTSSGALNDIWQYDPATNLWTWVKGAAATNQAAVFGTRGTGNAANSPGGRRTPAYTTDKLGRLWLFGGLGYGASTSGSTYQNDLWRYDPATNEWTWIKGNNETNVLGNYGTQGVSASANLPGGRYGALSWIDKAGNFWLFGGYGYTSTTTAGYLNDLWKYDPVKDEWTWVKGASTLGQVAVYGTKGTPAAANTPGGRYGGGNYWTDAAGNFWLFGGYGYASVIGYLNDMWKYDPVTNQWTWINGSTASNENAGGVYGTKGSAAATNTPGGRRYPVLWKDNGDNIWLAAGYGYTGSGASDYGALNDIWKYDAASNQWTWMYFDKVANQYAINGTKEVAANTNKPGSRLATMSWRDTQGSVWFFGGQGYGASTGSFISNLSDLWQIKLNLAPLVDSIKVSTAAGIAPVIENHGGTLAMKATVFPATVSQAVSWSIIPVTGTATIDANGVVTAQTNGTVWVKAASVLDPTKKDTVLVTISNQAVAGTIDVRIYPNPTKDMAYLKISQLHPDLQVSLLDASGRLVRTFNTTANSLTRPLPLDLRALAAGVYFIRLQGAGVNINKRISKL